MPPAKETLHWIMVLPAAFLGFAASVVIAVSLEISIRYIIPSLPFNKGFMDFCDGAFAAMLFILAGTFFAPRYKLLTALCLLIVGAVYANYCVLPFYDPLYSHGAQTSIWPPLFGTYLGGLGTCTWIYANERRVRRKTARVLLPHI